MRNLGRICSLFVVLMLSASSAWAGTILFTSTLLGVNENPPNASPGTGTISALLDDVADTLSVTESFSGLTAPATAAHIHCCAGPGVNAAVVLPFVGFPNATSGTYIHFFNLNTDLVGLTPGFFIAQMEAGNAYANIHDANFPGGEIRGQLPAVPEPGSMLLCATGLLAAARSLRRRRQA